MYKNVYVKNELLTSIGGILKKNFKQQTENQLELDCFIY